MNKICSGCKEEKNEWAFSMRCHKKRDGSIYSFLSARCISCQSKKKMEWAKRTNSNEKRKAYFDVYNKSALANTRKAEWKKKNPEKNAAINKAWRQKNPEKQIRYASTYAKKYPAKVNAYNAMRKANKLRARPTWANLDAIRLFYEDAQWLSKNSGRLYSVDHIVPLLGKNVCGLHVESNLRVIPHSENCKKYNSFDEGLV